MTRKTDRRKRHFSAPARHRNRLLPRIYVIPLPFRLAETSTDIPIFALTAGSDVPEQYLMYYIQKGIIWQLVFLPFFPYFPGLGFFPLRGSSAPVLRYPGKCFRAFSFRFLLPILIFLCYSDNELLFADSMFGVIAFLVYVFDGMAISMHCHAVRSVFLESCYG